MSIKPLENVNSFPEQITNSLWAFSPNRANSNGTSWWLACSPEPVLIDCPPVNPSTIEALKKLSSGGDARILLTSREGHGDIAKIQEFFGWPVLLQEQEAYLLPGFSSLETFSNEYETISGLRLLWTPGPTPGSCVIHAPQPWNVMFCGRLLVPVAVNRLAAFRTRKTFHWNRQQKSLKKLINWIPENSRPSLASGVPLSALNTSKLLDWDAWQDHADQIDNLAN